MSQSQANAASFTISFLTAQTGYCTAHVRELCKAGFLKPARTQTGVRLFTQADIEKLKARRAQYNEQEANKRPYTKRSKQSDSVAA